MYIKSFVLGDVIKYMGLHLLVAKQISNCKGCYFNKSARLCADSVSHVGTCLKQWRHDGRDVIFVNLDKNRVPKKYLLNQKTRKKC